ncbi:16 kDa phloem protein 1 [Curcuma longa]|uniref:16 kDa phloem protein 1 n=1 Tax=Curcuma longa TaxID=136217 RepID=UPI003D9ED8E7
MKGGVLEVLLVSSEDLKHAHILGSSKYYVILRYGREVFTSKITQGNYKKVWWNEKFVFKLSPSEWKDVTKLRLSIMEKDKFHEDHFAGEATVYLRGVLKEGNQKGQIELKPAPYNVVLRDGTYKGEVKVGLKFISNVEVDMETERRGCSSVPERQPLSVYRTILNFTLLRIPWPRFLFFHGRSTDQSSKKNK